VRHVAAADFTPAARLLRSITRQHPFSRCWPRYYPCNVGPHGCGGTTSREAGTDSSVTGRCTSRFIHVWVLSCILSFGCTWSDRYVDENAGARGKGQVVLPTVHTCASPGPPASTLYLCTCIDPSRCSLKSIREPKAPLYWLSMPMYGCPSAHLCPVPITSLQNQG
jgi:hypothetical protein